MTNDLLTFDLTKKIMPKMNGTGPEGKGSGSGRGLGKCRPHTSDELLEKLGKGQAKRRNTSGGEGKGRRLRYNQQNDQK